MTHDNDDNVALPRAHLKNETDTLRFGALLGRALQPGLKIWLVGNLGSGKTTLTRGLVQSMGHAGKVKSPTYSLLESYLLIEPDDNSRLNLYHFDFYRLNTAEEYLDAGLDEYFFGTGVCIVEWPDKALPYLPSADLEIRIDPEGEGRRIAVLPVTSLGRLCARKLTDLMLPNHPA